MRVVSKNWLRGLLLTAIYLLGLFGIVASGGGGSEGDEEVTAPIRTTFIIEKTVSETVDHSIGLTVQVTYLWRLPYQQSYHYVFPVYWNNDLTGDSGSGEVVFSRECWIWGIVYPFQPPTIRCDDPSPNPAPDWLRVPLAIGDNKITVEVDGKKESVHIVRADDTTPPRMPTGVSAQAIYAGAVITWNPLIEATSYNIYYASSPGVTKSNYSTLPDGAKIVGASSPQSLTGLTDGTVYYFVVTGVNSFGEGEESIEAMVSEPIAPTSVSAQAADTGVMISWDLVIDVAGYNIYYASSPGVTKSNYSTLPNGNKLTLPNDNFSGAFSPQSIQLLTYEDYYFVVTSSNTGGESVESLEVMAKPEQILILSFDIKTFRFSWLHVPNATHYKLLENPDGDSGFSQVGSDIPQGTYTYDHIVPLFKRINASYILQSCVGVDCDDLGFVTITDNLVDAIGYFKASNSDKDDSFGNSVSLSGDGSALAVGAYNEGSNSGAVYVFTRSSNNWGQQAYIKASNIGYPDFFGWSVSLSDDGNTLAVGATREASNATGINGNQSDNSAIQSGAVYVFTRSGSNWTQQAYIKASNTDISDNFGWAVSLSDDGNTLAVGAEGEDSNDTGINGNQTDNSAERSGAVYIFTRSGSNWTQQAYIKASNTDISDQFGKSVSLNSDGSTLAVGALAEDSNATGINGNQADNSASLSGAVYIFTRSGSNWSQQAFVKASNTGVGDFFGSSVSLNGNGNTLVVGARNEDSSTTGIDSVPNELGPDSGAVYVFTRNGSTWAQQAYVKATGGSSGDLFGESVSIAGDGNTLAVGAIGEDSNISGINENPGGSERDSGAAYVFIRDGITWTQKVLVKASNTNTPNDIGEEDHFGESVSLSGDGNTLGVGAIGEDSNAIGINGNQSDNSAVDSGAVYLY